MVAILLASSIHALSQSAHAAAGTITGTVFEDKDMNGVNDGSDVGVSGVIVSAYDSTGVQVGTTTTNGSGAYSITISNAATTAVRIEFSTPNGYQPSFQGSGNGTSIQFVTIPSTGVNYAVQVPGAYCENNSVNVLVASACQRPGIASNTDPGNPVADQPTLAATTWDDRQTPSMILKNSQTGATWGIANQRSTGLVWTSAVLRRHSGFGPRGIGGLYVAHPKTGLVTSFDLSTYMALSANNSLFTDANRGFQNDTYMSLDTPGFANVGKVGIGDIDFSPDGTKLYVMNLYEKKIYVFPIGGTVLAPTLGTPTAINVVDPGCANVADIRPWALKVTTTDVYAGVVCSNETASASAFTQAQTSGVTTRPSGSYLQKYSLGSQTWTTASTINMSYARGHEVGCDNATNANATGVNARFCETPKWHAWTDNYAAIKAAIAAFRIGGDPAGIGLTSVTRYFPEPLFVGIDLLADGSVVAGFADRFSMQMGWQNVSPTATITGTSPLTSSEELVEGRSTGDVLLLCNISGTLTVESNGSCGSRTAPTYSNARLNSVNTYKEFFDDNLGGLQNDHVEISQGAVAVWPPSGTQNIAMSAYDPGTDIFEGGLRWLKSTDGSQHTSNNTYYTNWYSGTTSNSQGLYDDQSTSFGKAAGMADVEIICDRAPVQIGNRVWIDSNSNGIQDAGEVPVGGVTVRLYNALGSVLLGTAVTNNSGEYYFSSTVSESSTGNGDNAGGGLAVGLSYLIRVDRAQDFTSGGPLNGYALTTATSTSSATDLDTSVDSNASVISSYPQISVGTVLPGINDHTYDVGFVLAPVTTTTAAPTTTVAPTTTAAPTTTTAPTTTVASSPATVAPGATSTTTTIPVSIQTSIKVSCGDYVWWDENRNGIQDSSEKGIPNVVLSIKKADGSLVRNVFGDVVKPTKTNGSGYYSFDNLPPGQYTVTVVAPAGFGPTIANAGPNRDVDSSTDSATSVILTKDGQRDPTLDFGFFKPAPIEVVSVGNLVWRDLNGDGLQGSADHGVKGVILHLRNTNGSLVRNIFGQIVTPQTTGRDGKYSFDNLLPGRYRVRIVYPLNYIPTTPNRQNRGKNSSTNRALSLSLRGGERDATLDFGMVFRGTRPTLPVTR